MDVDIVTHLQGLETAFQRLRSAKDLCSLPLWFARTVLSGKVLLAGSPELLSAGKGCIVGARQQAENRQGTNWVTWNTLPHLLWLWILQGN